MREGFDIPKFEEEDQPVDIKYYLIKYLRFWPIYLISMMVFLAGVFMYHRYTVEDRKSVV